MDFYRTPFAIGFHFAFVIFGSICATADDIIIDVHTGNTAVLDGGDSLSIAPSGGIVPVSGFNGVVSTGGKNWILNEGLIDTNGVDVYGVYNSGSDNSSITNNGLIFVQGTNARAIYIHQSNNSAIINNGTIQTFGLFAHGIFNEQSDHSATTQGHPAIINNGTIFIEGVSAVGIRNHFSPNSAITNTGRILTVSAASEGIYSHESENSAVLNSGFIRTSGHASHAIKYDLSANSPIFNTGTIHTLGDHSHGLHSNASPNSSIANSGLIHTKGKSAYGVFSANSSNSPVVNSGFVVSERSNAFRLQGRDDALILKAPGYIGGKINFKSPTLVNLETGRSHSVLWDLSTGTMVGGNPNSISGPVPWFYNSTTKQFATHDPTGLAGSINQLGDMTSLLSLVRRCGMQCQSGRDTKHYGKEKVDFLTALTQSFTNGQFWSAGFGSSIEHRGDNTSFGQSIDQTGYTIGYKWHSTADLFLNILGGKINSAVNAEHSRFAPTHDLEIDGWFAAAYGAHQMSGYNLDFGLAGGSLSFNSTRFVNDNLARTNDLTLGQSYAVGTFDSWFLAPEIGISLVMEQHGVLYSPSANIRYSRQEIDGYTETGSAANARVGARSLGLIESSFEISASRINEIGTLTGLAGYVLRRSVGDNTVSIVMLDSLKKVGFGNTNTDAAYLGLEADFEISPFLNLTLKGRGFLGSEMRGYQGMARAAATF